MKYIQKILLTGLRRIVVIVVISIHSYFQFVLRYCNTKYYLFCYIGIAKTIKLILIKTVSIKNSKVNSRQVQNKVKS